MEMKQDKYFHITYIIERFYNFLTNKYNLYLSDIFSSKHDTMQCVIYSYLDELNILLDKPTDYNKEIQKLCSELFIADHAAYYNWHNRTGKGQDLYIRAYKKYKNNKHKIDIYINDDQSMYSIKINQLVIDLYNLAKEHLGKLSSYSKDEIIDIYNKYFIIADQNRLVEIFDNLLFYKGELKDSKRNINDIEDFLKECQEL